MHEEQQRHQRQGALTLQASIIGFVGATTTEMFDTARTSSEIQWAAVGGRPPRARPCDSPKSRGQCWPLSWHPKVSARCRPVHQFFRQDSMSHGTSIDGTTFDPLELSVPLDHITPVKSTALVNPPESNCMHLRWRRCSAGLVLWNVLASRRWPLMFFGLYTHGFFMASFVSAVAARQANREGQACRA